MANPNIVLYRSDTLVEIGTEGSPIDIGFCEGGEVTELSYDILLYNDKGDVLGSEDAYDLTVQLLRLYETTELVSDGSPSQTLVAAHAPIITDEEEEVTVNGTSWRRVDNFIGVGPTEEVYTFNYTTGTATFGNDVNGKIPPNGETMAVRATPDLNTFGKELYAEQWVSIRSNGAVQNNVDITLELGTKLSNTQVQVLHYPEIVSVTGVYDNPSGTGTNYYTSGSFNATTGVITLGTSLTASNPYITYSYRLKDDAQSAYTPLGGGDSLTLDNRLPKNNAKRLQVRVEPPVSANTEGGSYLQFYLRVLYKF